MRDQIRNYIQAGYPAVYLVSSEEQRVEAELASIAKELGFKLNIWSLTTGVIELETGATRGGQDTVEAMDVFAGLDEKSLLVCRDFHMFLADPNPLLFRKIKDVLAVAKTKNRVLIIVGCQLKLPPELEKEIVVVEFSLPDRDTLKQVLSGLATSAGKELNGHTEAILDAASGLTVQEAENAFALSLIETKDFDPILIAREKAQAVKKSGILELVDVKESLDSIGGLDVLKGWLVKRRRAFSKEAKAYGLPTPKGLLMTGIPGTGKSLTAKATASNFGVPLLRLDAGRLFGGLVGQSEANIRSVIKISEAIAPCVLWLDEVEKGLSGSRSSGMTDGGTAARVFGSFISWMQEKTAPVFVVATANDVTQLPPELLRKGRWDDLFFVDLPNEDERKEIWNIQIAKHGRDPKDFDIRMHAKSTAGLTGSEIEAVFVDALYRAFDAEMEPTDLTIAEVLTDFVPLSKTMAEQIRGLRDWAQGRARFATTPAKQSSQRKLAA